MQRYMKVFSATVLTFVSFQSLFAQQKEQLMIIESPEVKVVQVPKEKRVDIIIGGHPFTSFL